MKCDFCKEEFEKQELYGDNICTNCGAKYSWDEYDSPYISEEEFRMIYEKRMKENSRLA